MVQTNLAMLVPFLIATTLAFPQVILASSSYELPKFTSSSKYFGQSDPDIDVSKVNVSDNFGLINKYSWKDVIDSLSDNENYFIFKDTVKDGITLLHKTFLVPIGIVIGNTTWS